MVGCENENKLEDYNIGGKGPGGGIIFFIENGQYKECSNVLGSYSHAQAVTIAQNYKGGGYNNWHLPYIQELMFIYENLKIEEVVVFVNDYYWSLSPAGSDWWCLSFNNGNQVFNVGNEHSILSVRTFTP